MRPNTCCAVCLDVQGPEIHSSKHKDDKIIVLAEGSIFEINCDEEYEGDENCVGCNYESLTIMAKQGGTVYLSDGLIMGKIIEVGEVSINDD